MRIFDFTIIASASLTANVRENVSSVCSQLWGSILTDGVACDTYDRIEKVTPFPS